MPQIRPFRALRFDPDVTGDLGAVVAPPYDVIGADLHRRLLARHPKNAVRLDLPSAEPPTRTPTTGTGGSPGRSPRGAPTGRCARTRGPACYVYEQAYRVPGTDVERTQRGFFARLRLEPFGPGGGVLPHERTLAGPQEDRYRLLRATGVNTSPVVGLYEDPSGRGRGDARRPSPRAAARRRRRRRRRPPSAVAR